MSALLPELAADSDARRGAEGPPPRPMDLSARPTTPLASQQSEPGDN